MLGYLRGSPSKRDPPNVGFVFRPFGAASIFWQCHPAEMNGMKDLLIDLPWAKEFGHPFFRTFASVNFHHDCLFGIATLQEEHF
jgi:hypothetical protein